VVEVRRGGIAFSCDQPTGHSRFSCAAELRLSSANVPTPTHTSHDCLGARRSSGSDAIPGWMVGVPGCGFGVSDDRSSSPWPLTPLLDSRSKMTGPTKPGKARITQRRSIPSRGSLVFRDVAFAFIFYHALVFLMGNGATTEPAANSQQQPSASGPDGRRHGFLGIKRSKRAPLPLSLKRDCGSENRKTARKLFICHGTGHQRMRRTPGVAYGRHGCLRPSCPSSRTEKADALAFPQRRRVPTLDSLLLSRSPGVCEA
jgi:hypothetical protein